MIFGIICIPNDYRIIGIRGESLARNFFRRKKKGLSAPMARYHPPPRMWIEKKYYKLMILSRYLYQKYIM